MKLVAFSIAGSAILAVPAFAEEKPPATSVPLENTLLSVFSEFRAPGKVTSEEAFANFRLVLRYDAKEGADARLQFGEDEVVDLPAGSGQTVDVAFEHIPGAPARMRVWQNGKMVSGETGAGSGSPSTVVDAKTSSEELRFDRDFTAMVRFRTEGSGGTLIAKAMPEGKWVADAKALFIKGDRLTYDLGWKGAVRGKRKLSADKEHVAVLVSDGGALKIFVDGRLDASKPDFTAPDPDKSVMKIGEAASDFGGAFGGSISTVRFWRRALDEKEIASLSNGNEASVNTPDFNWSPGSDGGGELVEFGAVPGYAVRPILEAGDGFVLREAFVQPLAMSDHAGFVAGWDEASLKRGGEIYNQLCVTCHGTLEAAGSLPTAPRFHLNDLHNGTDPYRMLQTLEKGYGQMVPQPQYTTAQKYDVIHYLRETFLKDRNADQFVSVDEAYLAKLPRGMSLRKEKQAEKKLPQYLLQDFGNVLQWTLQVEPDNIAQKGIVVRVDDGPGGVSKGRAWMLYDHDTMRLAACWTGDRFVDWKGIAFDGSHGTHTSIVGEKQFVFPNEPMWANPETGDYADLRITGRDGVRYGPLPTEWVRLKGIEIHGDQPLLRYTVGETEVRERPRLSDDGAFERWIECGPGKKLLKLRIDAEQEHVVEPREKPVAFGIRYSEGKAEVFFDSEESLFKEKAVAKRFEGRVTTLMEPGKPEGAWAVDVISLPEPDKNPWQSWMRASGFDFFEGGKSAAVCTWNGDVWIVDGIDQAEGELTWQRICSGLFQPLGLKIVDGEIYVGCRDMIAILRDLNGDRETDYIENFNSDHQVTEHFHEFAMGLQTDDDGNFYYAKSARHAKTPVVPHHGTLLKVSADGSETSILATGFRAANGVCLNPDGSFMVTDQEGHWNPKNRINWVDGTGAGEFYGNMWGYHDVTDESDSAMRQPLCWITNAFDRSPAELLWVPEDSAWKPLHGSLLNLSYGAGKIYTVPFEKVGGSVQGGMCAFPIEPFPTGVMRGRFSPKDGQLYACGMFAWAGNRHQPGGFYRIRYTGGPAYQPVGLTTDPATVTITFTDPLDRESSEDSSSWVLRAWDLKRSKQYGSKHYNERTLAVEKASLSDDGKTVTLTVPDLAPTWGMSIDMSLKGADGTEVKRLLHNSIFDLE
ncbi:heme-binding domain-containing protein [Haloferula helveola]|uniref:Heme-binding domain-containing protein n=1 Tax=Haloferula helveola TaxID=490095 RepID=A0ABN6GY90_9BACT|nr:heme-binding domain-containing protein [Haloferula helveola]